MSSKKVLFYFLVSFFVLIIFNTILNILANEKQKIDFIKVAKEDVALQEIALIKNRTHTIISKIEKGEYYKNVKGNIVEKIDIPHQKEIQKQIKNNYGTYIGLQFELLLKSKTNNPFMNKIYLFKGDFASKKDVEIRIYTNIQKEIVGLNIMSWEKEYFDYL